MSNDQSESTNTVYQIAVRFGDEILQAGFTSTPNLVLNHYAQLGISPAEMMFTIHVWQYWWNEREPYPSLKSIATKMNVSWRQVHNYASGLRKKGYLVVKQRSQPGRGQITSEYDFSPLIRAVVSLAKGGATPLQNPSGGGMKNLSQAPLKPISDEEYKDKNTHSEEDPLSSNNLEYETLHINTLNKSVSKKGKVRKFESQNRKQDQAQRQGQDEDEEHSHPALTPSNNGPKSIGQILNSQNLALRRAKTASESAYNPISGAKARGRPPKAPERIAWMIKDFSSEFHDEDVTDSNIGQAARLYKASGLSEQAFCQLMYEAKSVTKQYKIDKPARGEAGNFGLKNKMPYFFKVLRDLLGMKEASHVSQSRAFHGG
jgi:hypothetical protein